LVINPHVGLDYSVFNLNNVKAVLHAPYHSFTLSNEVFDFYKKCKNLGIEFYVAPFKSSLLSENAEAYPSVKQMQNAGVKFVLDNTLEFAYAKLLVEFFK
jgi:L-asparaginase